MTEFVIGQYADYYAEHDGMVEEGPGCSERLYALIRALPEGDPRKIEVPPPRDPTEGI